MSAYIRNKQFLRFRSRYNEADRLSLTFFTFSRRGIPEQDCNEQRDRKHIANPIRIDTFFEQRP